MSTNKTTVNTITAEEAELEKVLKEILESRKARAIKK
jgi:hypothetical protein